jgi:tRNA A-37 threonylcarbamoyl transferase component Bud32
VQSSTLIPTIVRLANGWDDPVHRAFCAELEAISREVRPEEVIHRGRNVIFRHRVVGDEVAVKRFPVSGGRRLVYRLRTSKAVRAFDHATRLLAIGVGTPRPLAAVEVRHGRALAASYYCCALVSGFREVRELKRPDSPGRELLLEELGAFVGRLHELGAMHRDLTSGNVLLLPDPSKPGSVSFQLVDINRMRFGKVGVRAGLANLAQLRLHDNGLLLAGYCRARGVSPSDVGGYYRLRSCLRSAGRTLKDRTRPVRRRLGL